MERIFQHDHGRVTALEGLEIQGAKILINEDDDSIVVIWLCSRQDNTWYRIFIDGIYCAVDAYQTDGSRSDLDDGIKMADISSEFGTARILTARVENQVSDNRLCLILETKLQSWQLNYDTVSGQCRLEKSDRSVKR